MKVNTTMKVSNFNGNFLPNKQNQKSNLQNKALTQNSMSFTGSSASNSLSAMGRAQVNMNKSNNINFKGQVVSHTAEGAFQIVAEVAAHAAKVPPPAVHNLHHELNKNFQPVHKAAKKFDQKLVKEIKKAGQDLKKIVDSW